MESVMRTACASNKKKKFYSRLLKTDFEKAGRRV